MVVIGPESTGKSTLSEALAKALYTAWVPEYAREYLEIYGIKYEEQDLLAIAEGQLQSEDEQCAKAQRLLICDTDLYVIKVWSEHKYGHCNPQILEQIAARHYDLYLLTGIDIGWQQDPMREHPETEMRQYFYTIYKDIVIQSGIPWVEITGDEDNRLKQAMAAVKTYPGMPN